jgi:hypothetical protein
MRLQLADVQRAEGLLKLQIEVLADKAGHRTSRPSPESSEEVMSEKELIAELLAALKALVDWQGVEHQATAGPDGDAEDCPGDDTCECPIVAQVNAAIRKAEQHCICAIHSWHEDCGSGCRCHPVAAEQHGGE